MRIAVYTDYEYTTGPDGTYAERSFALFLAGLAERVGGLVVFGRLRPAGGTARYRLPDNVELVPLPYYQSLADPVNAGVGMLRSLRIFWHGLKRVDVCWLLGPHPLALLFAALAALRGRRVALGVRQDMIAYTKNRYPDRRIPEIAARALDAAYRGLGLVCPVVAVGPAIAASYRRSRRVLEIAVSLVSEADVSAAEKIDRDYGGNLRILSVGRIDEEKNPLMLAEVLAGLDGAERADWTLTVCGEGPLEAALGRRLEELGVADRAELRGYVTHGEEMRTVYGTAHALLHVSWTEGLPQVIVEALAARLPVVATDVGGIADAFGHATLLVEPGDTAGAVAALQRIGEDPALRASMAAAAGEYARDHTLEAEVGRVADFLQGATPE